MPDIASLLGTELPLIQAPMAGVQDHTLALAAAGAGALGSLPCAMLDATRLEAAMRAFAPSGQAINLNFFCHTMAEPDAAEDRRWRDALAPYYREYGIAADMPSSTSARRPLDAATVDLMAAFRPRIVSFHFGLPDAVLMSRIKGWGATVLSSATTVEEGLWLQRRGVDAVIAQGTEAGGHRGHFLSDNLALQSGTRDLVASLSKTLTVPVIAAGGIGDRADVQALLAAGASAVQAGTAYLLCPEATTSAVHRTALQQPTRAGALTNLFSGRPARGLVNRLMHDLGPLSDLPPAFPRASQALAPLRAAAEAQGRDDFSPLWSGTRPGRLAARSAAEVTRHLMGLG